MTTITTRCIIEWRKARKNNVSFMRCEEVKVIEKKYEFISDEIGKTKLYDSRKNKISNL